MPSYSKSSFNIYIYSKFFKLHSISVLLSVKKLPYDLRDWRFWQLFTIVYNI